MIRTLRIVLLVLWAFAHPAPLFAQSSSIENRQADWRQKLGTFRVGIVGEGRPVLAARRIQPFREALRRALGMDVEVFVASDYANLISAQRASRIEYGVYSATAFAAAWVLCKCLRPVAAAQAADGSSSFRVVLIGRDGGPASPAQLAGQTVLVPGKGTFSGWVFPMDQLARQGLDPSEIGWTIEDSGSADRTLAAFSAGKGAAMVGWMPVSADQYANAEERGTMQALAKAGVDDARIIWRSDPIPHGAHAVRANLPTEARDRVATFLLDLRQTNIAAFEAIEPRREGGLATIALSDYRPVINAVRKIVLFSSPLAADPIDGLAGTLSD